MKPKLFIGSSVEGLELAYGVQENLEHDAEGTVWTQGVFDLSNSTLDGLLVILGDSDFGAFTFTPDDVLKIRKETQQAARDNVVCKRGGKFFLSAGEDGKRPSRQAQDRRASWRQSRAPHAKGGCR